MLPVHRVELTRELGMSQLLAQWVITAYVLILTAFVATGGRLGDMFGHGRVFIAGATLLGLGSLGAGVAPSSEVATAATLLIRFATLWFGVALGALALWGFHRVVRTGTSDVEES